MSTVVIVSLIAASLFILIAVAFTLQSMEKSSKEKGKFESALKGRAKNFDHVLEQLPQGFLSPELYLLVCKSKLDANEQLNQLNPKNATYAADAEAARQRLDMAKTQPSAQKHIVIKDSKQVKEIQQILSMLFSFIQTLQKSNRLSPQQAKTFCIQINQLIMQGATDGLLGAAKDAVAKGKYRLAIHYHHMAIDRFKKDNANGAHNSKIAELQQAMEKLDKEADAEAPSAEINENAKEWENLTTPDNASWKKKAVYD